MSELEAKIDRVRELLNAQKLDALLLNKISSFAWATCGASSYVNTAAADGAAALLITQDRRFLLTDQIEAPRLVKEERLADQGWEFVASPWYSPREQCAKLVNSTHLGADGSLVGFRDLSSDISQLRMNLLPEENIRFRELGSLCAEAMGAVVQQTKPGMSEFQIAAILGYETLLRGGQAIVNLVATDERIYQFRHPLPTAKQLKNYAMIVLCARRYGLVCSMTRLVHFGRPEDELRRKMKAVAAIDGVMIAETRPGCSIGQIFATAQKYYAQVGYSDEWKLHHQGGAAGYEPRELVATPGCETRVNQGQVYAWNPSITGIKSEDTILVGESENEVLTAMPNWPTIEISHNGQMISRPAILEQP